MKRAHVLLTVPTISALLLAACGTKPLANVIIPDNKANLELISASPISQNVSGKQAGAIFVTATLAATAEPSPTSTLTEPIQVVIPSAAPDTSSVLVVPTEVLPAPSANDQPDSSEQQESDDTQIQTDQPTDQPTAISPTVEPTLTTTAPSAVETDDNRNDDRHHHNHHRGDDDDRDNDDGHHNNHNHDHDDNGHHDH